MNDRLTVWKRSQTTPIVFEGEEDDGDEEDVASYRYIPPNEQILPVDVAALVSRIC